MHTAKRLKKGNTKKEMFRYNDQFLVVATLTPPKQHQKSNFFKSGAFKKETVRKHRRRPIVYLRFSP
jgi:hypothetical protein